MATEEPMQVTPAAEPVAVAAPAQLEAPGTEAAAAAEPAAPVVPSTAADAVLTDKTQKLIADEKEANANATPRAKPDVQSLPTRQYLDQSVVPILLQALTALSKERPPDAIEFLIAYLMKNKASFQQQLQNSS